MKAIIQRVLQSSVSVDNEVISKISRGLTVLIGIHRDDTIEDLEYLVKKILNVRLFEDENGKRWCKSVMDMQYEILCVSQFTLYFTLKGNKPDFHYSMKPDKSRELYDTLLSRLRSSYKSDLVKDGRFGAMMNVQISNDGPVTIEIQSPTKNLPTQD